MVHTKGEERSRPGWIVVAIIVAMLLIGGLVFLVAKYGNKPQATQSLAGEVVLLQPKQSQVDMFNSWAAGNQPAVKSLQTAFGNATLAVATPDRGSDDYGEWDVNYYGSDYPYYGMLSAVWAAGTALSQAPELPATLSVPETLFLQLVVRLDDKEQAQYLYPVGPWGHQHVLPVKPPKHKTTKPKTYVRPTTVAPVNRPPAQPSKPPMTTTAPPPPVQSTTRPPAPTTRAPASTGQRIAPPSGGSTVSRQPTTPAPRPSTRR